MKDFDTYIRHLSGIVAALCDRESDETERVSMCAAFMSGEIFNSHDPMEARICACPICTMDRAYKVAEIIDLKGKLKNAH